MGHVGRGVCIRHNELVYPKDVHVVLSMLGDSAWIGAHALLFHQNDGI